MTSMQFAACHNNVLMLYHVINESPLHALCQMYVTRHWFCPTTCNHIQSG